SSSSSSRPPPASPLFPYTTLFRSLRCCERVMQVVAESPARSLHREAVPFFSLQYRSGRNLQSESSETIRLWADAYPSPRRIVSEDRKSTRLNSSHVAISYAVFCLR